MACSALALLAVLCGCAASVPRPSAVASYAVLAMETDASRLGRYVREQTARARPERPLPDTAYPAQHELAGFRLIAGGVEALAVRLALIDQAERAIDLQYYIFNGDQTGSLVAERLLAAADRGVRVRLLLDDMGARIGDTRIARLTAHPNIEIRLFNPVTLRSRWLRLLSQVGEFGRINNRMHNKLMVVDNQVMVTGGRNVGDEYFGLRDLDFQDIDLIGIGPVSVRASVGFDDYWNDFQSVPVEDVTRIDAGPRDLERLRQRFERLRTARAGSAYFQALEGHPALCALDDDVLEWRWGVFEWLHDPPAKAAAGSTRRGEPYLGRQLVGELETTRSELLVITPYLIPGRDLLDRFAALDRRGVRVGILTNSLATTDVLAVHSSYARYRRPLLEAGVVLWELRPGAGQQERPSAFVGDSRASLHAKTFVNDREALFIGSINLDPRSMNINTESGVLVRDPTLAVDAVRLFEAWTRPSHAYRLQLGENGTISWEAGERRAVREPHAGFLRRLVSRLVGLLPIESQL
ncbi:MAG: phospholipase D family protein [Pseudomonadales bacterium]|nr:phospholipase D family protein [Pseudomonadales bacterium]